MGQRYDFSIATALGNVDTPSVASDAVNKAYVDSRPVSTGTVTTVTSAVSGFSFGANPNTTPALTIQNASAPTTQFLRGDGQWQTAVTSVGLTSSATPLTIGGATITGAGSFTLSWGVGQIPVANLGSGTGSNTNFLRGDGQWAVPPVGTGTVTTVTSTVSGFSFGANPNTTPALTVTNASSPTTQYLRADGSWQTAVTSVGLTSSAAPLTVSGTTIIGAGAFTLSWGSGQIPVANLGSGSAGNTTFLRGDGTWAVPSSAAGTVTSVTTNITGFTFTNSSTTPQLSIQNSSSPTSQFLRGDGSWQPVLVSAQVAGQPIITGALTLAAGTNVTLTQSGNTITIAASGGGGGGGTVTNVTSNISGLTFLNGATTPQLNTANVTSATTQYLRGDGQWQPAVTSVAMTVPTGFAIGGSPITTNGTLALTYSGLIPVTSLGSGTPNVSTFLSGNGTWIPIVVAAGVNGQGTTSGVLNFVNGTNTTFTRTGNNFSVNVAGAGTGTVTTVTSTINAFSFGANPTITPALTITNASSPTTQFLRGDGNWQTAVTSVAMTVPTGFAIGGSPITTNGTLALTYSGLIPASSLGSGTANAGVFLRGDQTWDPVVTSVGVNGISGVSGAVFFVNSATASFTRTGNNISVAVSGVGGGTVTTVTSNLNAFNFGANPTITPALTITNASSPTTQFLRGDGNWQTAVTSVDMTVPTGFAIGGRPITGSGTLALTYSGQIPVTSLGTGTASSSNFLRGDGTWATPPVSTGTVTSVTTNITGFTFGTNTTTVPVLAIQNASSPTTQYLRGDGSWQPVLISAQASGQAAITGALTLAAGTNVNLAQSGNTITISVPNSGVQFLYQLQDVNVNESSRTQIVFTGSTTPIDEVQRTVLNIQPGVTFTGLAAGDFIAPVAGASEIVQILSITTGGSGSTNINLTAGSDATIWIGTGTFTSPQFQTIYKVGILIPANDVLSWNGTAWTNRTLTGGTTSVWFSGAGAPTTVSGAALGNFYWDTTSFNAYVMTALVGQTQTWTAQPNLDSYVRVNADGEIALKIGSSPTPPGLVFTNTNTTTGSYVPGVFPVDQPFSNLVAALLAIGDGIVQNTSGNWTLPANPILISITQNPTATQYTRIMQITQSALELNLVVDTMNQAYFSGSTYPQTLYIVSQRFNFQTPPQTEILRLARTVVPTTPAQNFAIRDDVAYVCVDANNNTFSGIVTNVRATGTIVFAQAVADGTNVSNIGITFTTTVPSSLVDGTPIVTFATPSLFNITGSILSFSGGNYTLAGKLNTVNNTSVPAGTYTVIVTRAAKAQTLQNLVGGVTLTSTDSSLAITTNTTNNSINLSTSGSAWLVGGNVFADTLVKKIGTSSSNPLSVVVNNSEAININYSYQQISPFTVTGSLAGAILDYFTFASGYNFIWTSAASLYQSTTPGGTNYTLVKSLGPAGTSPGTGTYYSASKAVFPYYNRSNVTQHLQVVTDTAGVASFNDITVSPTIFDINGVAYGFAQSFAVSPNGQNACYILYNTSPSRDFCIALTNSFNVSAATQSFPIVNRNPPQVGGINLGFVVFKDNNTLYALEGSEACILYRINVTTGAVTSLGNVAPSATYPEYLFFVGDTMYLVTLRGLYVVNQINWTSSLVASLNIPSGVSWGSNPFNSSALKLYYGNSSSYSVWELDGTGRVLVDGGSLQIADGTSTSLGNGTGYNSPLLAANAITPSSLTAGASGQVLTSRGTGLTPYWNTIPFASIYQSLYLITSTTAGTPINEQLGTMTTAAPFSGTFVTQLNNLGLTFNTATGAITGWVAGATYELVMSANLVTSIAQAITTYWSAVPGAYPVSFVTYGNGVTVGVFRATVNRAGDGVSETEVGWWVPTLSTTPLYLQYFVDALAITTTTTIRITLSITRVS